MNISREETMGRKALYKTSLTMLGLVSMLTGAPAASAADMPESWRPGVALPALPAEDVCAGVSGMWLFKRVAYLRAHPECAPSTTDTPWSGEDSKSSDRPHPTKPVDVVDPPAPAVPPLLPCHCVIPPPEVFDRLPPIPDFG